MSCDSVNSVAKVGEVDKPIVTSSVCVDITTFASDKQGKMEVCQVNVEEAASSSSVKNCEVTPAPSSSSRQVVTVVVEKEPRHEGQPAESKRSSPTPSAHQNYPMDTEDVSKPVRNRERSLGDSNEINTIREFTSEQSTSVSGVLRFCKRRILFPYLKLLGIVGLKPLHSDTNDVHIATLVLSKIYLFLVVMALLAGYFLQFTVCFRRDIGFSYKDEIINPPYSTSLSEDAGGLPSFDKMLTVSNMKNKSKHADIFRHKKDQWWPTDKIICNGNIVYIYVLPSIFHFLAFFYMVHLHWVNDNEHFQNLMEIVFIQAALANVNEFFQRRLIGRMHVMMGMVCFWIVIATSVQITQVVVSKIYINVWIEPGEKITASISALLIVTTILQNAIQLTVVASYSVHCYLICTYAELLRVRLMHHSFNLLDCMKELGELGQLLHYLNYELATGLAPLLLINGIYAAGTVDRLIKYGTALTILEIVSLVITAVLWIFIVFYPLTQASKLSTCCFKLKNMGHMVRMRPFGYQFVPRFELDSFLLFVSNLNLQVKILKVPITAAMLSTVYIFLVILMFWWGYFQ